MEGRAVVQTDSVADSAGDLQTAGQSMEIILCSEKDWWGQKNQIRPVSNRSNWNLCRTGSYCRNAETWRNENQKNYYLKDGTKNEIK